VKHDLPTPSKGTELAITPPTPSQATSKVPPSPLPDELRYARDRTGWAPQFENQKPVGEPEETLLDHQTFLEGKLDDKFFGGRNGIVVIDLKKVMLTCDCYRLVP
jgi:hypothetical protein